MSLIIVRMKMASSQTSTVWFTELLPLASDDRREYGIYIEQNEVPVRLETHCLHQSGIDTGKLPTFDHRSSRDLEKVQDLPYTKAVALALHLEHDNGALVGLPSLLLEQQVPVEHGEQVASNVDQSFDRIRHPGNSGSRKAGEDLTHDPCRGRADNLTDAKYDGVKRGGVSHLY
jgi:hypothetical protein